MSFKNLAIVDAIVFLGFGLPMLISTSILTDLFLARPEDLNESVEFLFKLFGIPLTGLGVLSILIRNAQPSLGRQAFLVLTVITGLGSAIVHIYGITQGLEKSSGWGTVIITIVTGIWAIMLLSKEKGAVTG
ncbi:MAG TPA: hypothetical protein PLC89_25345 [Haliscomenobacter sp.]|uniref:hypothetical protein n=1 Tax=Haliscomenobacter sp. TaxID=2717303 RepID=UPI002B5CFEC8|nr:hypothetical protein [Haliscomenobacter sp.]HOY20662.1 hypothetical protein [Haliscomenobacter sp.]